MTGKKNHRRYFKLAGITIKVDSEIPFSDTTFDKRFDPFYTDKPSEDMISIHHSFKMPKLDKEQLGKEIYRKLPWAIYEKKDGYIYLGISSMETNDNLHQIAEINTEHTHATIYSELFKAKFKEGGVASLTLFPTDQILMSIALSYRKGCYIHAAGAILSSCGFIFAGHSDAGKSTITEMLMDKAEILCDDRIIIRRWEDGFKIHGTWSHGDVPLVSSSEAPLKAIFFLEQANTNECVSIDDKKEIHHNLLKCLIKPLETGHWWKKMLELIELISKEIPCYRLKFDKSGKIYDIIASMCDG